MRLLGVFRGAGASEHIKDWSHYLAERSRSCCPPYNHRQSKIIRACELAIAHDAAVWITRNDTVENRSVMLEVKINDVRKIQIKQQRFITAKLNFST